VVEEPVGFFGLDSPSPLVLAAGSVSAGSTAGVAVGTGPASRAPEPHPARRATTARMSNGFMPSIVVARRNRRPVFR
jgi:hypothetical protein